MIRVSASQINTFRDCPRKWRYSRPDAFGSRANPAAALGSGVHGVLEGWLRDGTPIDPTDRLGAIAMSGVQYLPPPKTCAVEADFAIDRPGDIRYTGRIDLWNQRLGIVYDHKTTKDLVWAKSEDDLREDVQANLYALAAFDFLDAQRTPVGSVDLVWIYYTTATPYKSRKVHLTVMRESAERVIALADETAREIGQYMDKEPDAVPRNPAACDSYGGCPYLVECGPTAAQRIGSIMGHADLAARLRAGAPSAPAGNGAAVNPPEAAATTAPATTAAPAGGGLASRLRGGTAATASAVGGTPPPSTPAPTGAPAASGATTAPATGREATWARARDMLAGIGGGAYDAADILMLAQWLSGTHG